MEQGIISGFGRREGRLLLKVSASLLACDTAYLGETVIRLEKAGVDSIHLDVMDGHYVENFAFGPKVVQDLRKITTLPLEVHLEIANPEQYLATFARAGADMIIVQLDTCRHPIRILKEIHQHGVKAGVAINPGEELGRVKYFARYVDYVLCMSVEPGFGGQDFEMAVIDKIRLAKDYLREWGRSIPVGVDGGINFANVALVEEAGAEVVVVGTALFSGESFVDAVRQLKRLRGD